MTNGFDWKKGKGKLILYFEIPLVSWSLDQDAFAWLHGAYYESLSPTYVALPCPTVKYMCDIE